MTIPRPICRPTPYVGKQATTRLVLLKHCQILTINAQLSDDIQSLIFGRLKLGEDYPLTNVQALHLIEVLNAPVPDPHPIDCCAEITVPIDEADLYLLNRWRWWLENWMANLLGKTDTTTIGGHILEKKIESLYGKFTDIKIRLARPDGSATVQTG